MEKKCHLTQKGPKAVGPYSTAVECGDVIYLSGMIPIDPSTQKIVEGTCAQQAARVFANIQIVLEEMGATMQDALKTTVYLTDLSQFGAVNAIYQEWFGPDYPARTCVEISKLPLGAQVEVEVIARRRG